MSAAALSIRTWRRTILPGRVANAAAVRPRSCSEVGVASGTHGSDGGSMTRPSGSVSSSTWISSTPGRAVDRGVVELGEQPDQPALQAGDDVPLPERAGEVEGTGSQPRHLLGQLGVVARGRQGQLPDVVLEVEVGVVDPVRVVQPERHPDELAAVHLEQVQPLLHGLAEVGVQVAAARTRRVEDRDGVDVAELRGRLHGQEARVEPGELLHRSPPSMRSGPRSACSGVLSPGRRATGRCRRSSGPLSPR